MAVNFFEKNDGGKAPTVPQNEDLLKRVEIPFIPFGLLLTWRS